MPTEQLPVRLTTAELAERGRALADLRRDIEATEAEAKDVAKSWKDRIKRMADEARDLAHDIHRGAENRSVDVEERFDLKRYVAETFRLDTGELVRSRPMTQLEIEQQQVEMFPRAVAKGSATS